MIKKTVQLTALLLLFSIFFLFCEKKVSPHLQKALILMEGRTDYSDPVFEEVLKELRKVPGNDVYFDAAQELISRIETVRRQIETMRIEEESQRMQKNAERELLRKKEDELLKSQISNRTSIFKQSEAEKMLNKRIQEMRAMEQKLIKDQRMKELMKYWTPTPEMSKTEPRDDSGRTEQYWRNRHNSLQKKMRSFENKKEYYKSQLDTLETSGLPRHMVLKNREKRQNILNNIENINSKIENTQNEIDKLKEDLRKAGGFSGWIR